MDYKLRLKLLLDKSEANRGDAWVRKHGLKRDPDHAVQHRDLANTPLNPARSLSVPVRQHKCNQRVLVSCRKLEADAVDRITNSRMCSPSDARTIKKFRTNDARPSTQIVEAEASSTAVLTPATSCNHFAQHRFNAYDCHNKGVLASVNLIPFNNLPNQRNVEHAKVESNNIGLQMVETVASLAADGTPAQSSSHQPYQCTVHLPNPNVPLNHEEPQTHCRPNTGAKHVFRSTTAASSISDETAIERFLIGSRR